MSRIDTLFQTLERKALVSFITACDPDYDTSLSMLKALPEAGADIIELGMPFTDPMADGPTIQLASERALEAGGSMQNTLKMVREFRTHNQDTPIVLMGYFNPVMSYGLDAFVKDTKDAGVDGFIIVDLPPEESAEFSALCKKHDLDFIRLITPTTDAERLDHVLRDASGFLYYVSITGVTGAASADLDRIKPHIQDIRTRTDLPIAIGFGIKTPDDAKEMAAIGSAVVVGSSIVQSLNEKGVDETTSLVKSLAAALRT